MSHVGLFTLSLVLSVCHLGSAEQDILLKPIKTVGDPVGIVLVQGAQIPANAYIPLATVIQEVAWFPIWVAIPAFPLDVPEPSAATGVERALKSLATAGMPSTAKIVTAGHSLGGAQIQDWTFKNSKQVAAQVLMGAGLLRKYRNGTMSTTYPVPTLAMGGTLDGLFRITRHAENFFHYCYKKPCQTTFPTLLIEGMSHMQFASGPPPALVKANDLKPEITYDVAHTVSGMLIVEFITATIFNNQTSVLAMGNEVNYTRGIVHPIILSQLQESSPHLETPCNSDFPMPLTCPDYPTYPNTKMSGSNPTDCACGTPWSESAQAILAGNIPNATITTVDAIHPVSDVNPIHLPHVWNNCTGSSTSCKLNTTTVTYPIYSALDGFDTGFSYISASELRTKLVSRERILTSIGFANVNYTATDVVPSLCAEINNMSWNWAKSVIGSTAAARFNRIGVPMSFGKDIFLGNAGPLWIENTIEYQLSSDKSVMNVYSPCTHTPINYSVSSAAGFHYCKLVSPARALEWMYLDGIRIKGGLSA